jgi:SHS2 domain-containing protein
MYRWIEHTSEVELEVTARCPEGVVRESLVAMSELLGEPRAAEPPMSFPIELEAADQATLFAAWLGELTFLAESRGVICEGVEQLVLGADRLRATVRGRPGVPRYLVKAATYHRLRFERAGRHWVANAVLDV